MIQHFVTVLDTLGMMSAVWNLSKSGSCNLPSLADYVVNNVVYCT